MLKIEAARVAAVANAQRAEDLFEPLQGAIMLEHATIPVYLTALFSIKQGALPDIAGILSSIAVEEMLHMTIACNVLNAIGGTPQLNVPGFVPAYPGPLPMNINSSLRVHLAPFSMARVEQEFMEIEEPEHPLDFPIGAEAAVEFATIGQFYGALIARIGELGDDIFTGDPARQVADPAWFPEDQLFAVTDMDSATRALRLVVEQGEGTTTTPLDPEGDVAHYYRFQEILKGRRLVRDPSVEQGFSFSGAPIAFDPSGVLDMLADPKVASYAPGSRARTIAEEFNFSYTTLLNVLHETFNGVPASLNRAMGSMFELRAIADQLTQTIDETSGKLATPTFEWSAAAQEN